MHVESRIALEMNALLQQHDSPEHWEYPRDFDRATEGRDFAAFLMDLETALGQRLPVETGAHIQDASFHSQIGLLGGALRFSNFGRMIAFTPDAEIAEEMARTVRQLAATHGYVLVPTSDLETLYPREEGLRLGIRTWWIRYFDYL